MSQNKKIFSGKKNFESKIKNKNNTITNNTRYDSYDTLMKKENIFDSKLKFKPIFERIHKNKKKFNSILLSNLEKREKEMEEIISLDILLNYIYQSGIPYKLDFKKHLKQVSIKEKINNNLGLEKINIGPLDYFNLETYRKGNIAQHKANRMNEEHLLKSKNFHTNKSCIPQEITVYTARNILKRFHIIKDNTKSKLFDYEKKYTKRISVKSERNLIKSPIPNKKKNSKTKLFSSISQFKPKKSSMSVRLKETKTDLDLPHDLMINTESKKIINFEDLNNFNLTDNEKSLTTNVITLDNPIRHNNISISDIVDSQESNKDIKYKKPKKNLKKLILNMNKSKIDENFLKFKSSFKVLKKYNKNRHNYVKTIELNDSDYDTKEEKETKEDENYYKVSKNIQETKDKIKKVIYDYDYMMNRRSFTERNKKENVKIIKMFSSLGQKTIDNMANDLATCQNHIRNKLYDFIDDNFTNRKSFKQLDPTLEIILDKKFKKESNNPEYNIKEDYDLIRERELKEYEKKEIDRLGELIGKINNKVAFDLSHYLILYNKNIGNKIEGIKNEIVRKEKLKDIRHIKKHIESQIYNLKKIKQRNLFKFNKIIHKVNDYYTKISRENKFNGEYKKLLGLNKKIK